MTIIKNHNIYLINRLIIIILLLSSSCHLSNVDLFNDSNLLGSVSGSSSLVQSSVEDFTNGTGTNIKITSNGEIKLALKTSIIKDGLNGFDKTNDIGNLTFDLNKEGLCLEESIIDEKWNKTYGGISGDVSVDIQQTVDGGYVIFGSTASYGKGNSDFWLLKLNESGVEMWNRTFGGTNEDFAYSGQQTVDLGYIMTGYTKSYGLQEYNYWIVKTNSTGIEEWNRTFSLRTRNWARSVFETSKGGYLISGYVGSSSQDAWIVKTNETGIEEWNKTYGGSKTEYVKSAIESSDGCFVISGRTNSYEDSSGDFWILKINETGTEQWNKRYGFDPTDQALDVKETSDGGYVMIGNAGVNGDIYLVKTNDTGDRIWDRIYGGPGESHGNSINQTSDGGYIITSYRPGGVGNSDDLWIIKINDTGLVQWEKTFGGNGGDYGRSAFQKSNKEYMVCGNTGSYGNGGSDIWLINTAEIYSNITNGTLKSSNLLQSDEAYKNTWFNYTSFIPNNSSMQIQFSQDYLTWYNSSGILNAWDNLSNGSNSINISFLNWSGSQFYYKILFSGNNSNSPILKNIEYSFLSYLPSGNFVSQSLVLNGTMKWNTLKWTCSKPLETNIYFKLRSANNLTNLLTKSFLGPDGSTSSYYMNPGLIWSGHNSDDYIQFILYLTTNRGNLTPTIYSVTLFYSYAPDSPLLQSPTNNTITNNNNPIFTWFFYDKDSNESGGFQWQADDNMSFSSIEYDSGLISSNQTFYNHSINLSDGVWYWRVRTNDTEGNWGSFSNLSNIIIDSTIKRPEELIAMPMKWTSNNSFIINWTNPFDLSGIRGAYYKLYEPPTSNTNGTYVESDGINNIGNISVKGEGSHKIYVWLKDKLNNVNYTINNSAYLYLDFTAPKTPMNISVFPNNYTSTNTFNITWTNSYDFSGINGTYYKMDNPPSNNNDGILISGSNISSILNLSVNGDGQHTVYVWLVDEAGNVDYSNYNTTIIYYDGTAPFPPLNITPYPSSWTSENSFTINWSNPSEFNGIGGVYYKLDSPPTSNFDGNFVAGSNITSIGNISVDGDGQHDIYIWLMDKKGNTNYKNYNTTKLLFDGSAPAAPTGLTASPVSWTRNNIFNITWINPPEISNIVGAYYKLDIAPTSNNDGIYVPRIGINSISNITVSGDGSHTIYIWLIDQVNNTDYKKRTSTNLFFDGNSPSFPLKVVTIPNNWTSINSFTISWTNPNDISGIAGAYYKLNSIPTSNTDGTFTTTKPISSISVPDEGMFTVYLWLKDKAGNLDYNNYNTTILYYDSMIKTPTEITTNPNDWTNTNSYNIDWTNPIDDSGIVKGAYHKLNSPPVSGTDGTWVGSKPITNLKVPSEGEHVLYIWLKDNAGNINHQNYATTTLFFDSNILAPLNVVATPDNWTNINSFNVEWDIPVDSSLISTGAYYKLNSPPISDTDGTWVGSNPITNIQVPEHGENTVYLWLKDEVGNVNYHNYSSLKLYYDNIAPAAPIDFSVTPSDWSNSNVFTIDWTDPSDLSGTKTGAYYYVGDNPPLQFDGEWTSNKPLIISNAPEGENNIYVWLEDKVGNMNHLNYASAALKYDPSPPEELTIEINDNSVYTNIGDVELDLTATDTISGVSVMSFSFDDSKWLDWEPFSTSKSITLPSGNGEKTIYLRVQDQAGNIAKASNSIILDNTPPESLSIVIDSGSDDTNTTDVKLDLGAFDVTSGVHQMSFSVDGKTWTDWEDYSETVTFELSSGDGEKTIYFRVTDKAGNIAEPVFDTITLNISTPNETPKDQDRDGDGYTDDIDAFPDDSNEWQDSDSDGVGDNEDAFPTDPLESKDTDSDGVGDNADAFPDDPTKWEIETVDPDKRTPDEKEGNVGLIAVIVVVIIAIIILLFFFIIKPRVGVKKEPEEPDKKGPEKPADTEIRSYGSQGDQYQSMYGDTTPGTTQQPQQQDRQRNPPHR